MLGNRITPLSALGMETMSSEQASLGKPSHTIVPSTTQTTPMTPATPTGARQTPATPSPRSPRTCSVCTKTGHDKRTCPTTKAAPAPAPTPPHNEALECLKTTLENPRVQQALIKLYSQSQSECKRNGRCGMEIGMSREKDQVAVLKLFLGDMIRLDIDNSLPEDFLIRSEKVSVKHSSSAVGTAIKAKWTSADTSVEADIRSMIEAEDSYYPHLLLTCINADKKTITFVGIAADQNKATIKTLKDAAFKVPKGNSRGIEYSSAAMKMLVKAAYFKVTITNADVNGGQDPIERRMEYLRGLGLCP